MLDARGRPKEALDCLTEAVHLDPSNSYAWDARGVVLSKMGKLEEALASFDQAIAADPKNALAHAHKAEVLEQRGIPRVN